MTNKYPSSAIVMELACCVVDWGPRIANHKKDELADGNTSRFTLPSGSSSRSQRCDGIYFQGLCRRDAKLNVSAREYGLRELDPHRTRAQKRRRREDKMRVRGPW